MIVPETGEVLSSSKANFREAFFLGVILVFFGLVRFGDSDEGLFTEKGFKGGEPNPTFFRVRSCTPAGVFDSPLIAPGGEFKVELEAAATAALAKRCCCKNNGDMGLELEPPLFKPKWF